MKILKLEQDFDTAIARAAEVLTQGGLIIYPTDTLYGIGADAFSDSAVDALYALKGREPGKPTHCIMSDLEMAARYAVVDDAVRSVAEKYLPGPLTLILRKKLGVEGGIARGMETIGIRIPENRLCQELARAFGRPITTPSANKAGIEPKLEFENVIADLDADLAIDAGPAPRSKPSTVIDLSSGTPIVLREGAIPAEEILSLFRKSLQ